MIKSLYIDNYALLKKVVIDFKDGFTCISGETGSGKSIMLDALSLLFGKRLERFSASEINQKSIIEGVFTVRESHRLFFENHDLDFAYETIVRREINLKGKSRAFINDTPVLVHTLYLFGKQIIEIYAQDQKTILKDKDSQFELVDQLSNSKQYLKKYQADYTALDKLKKDLEVIKSQGSLSAVELEFLKFQYKELDNANILKGEKEDVEGKINLLENVDGIANAIADAERFLNNEQGVIDCLTGIKKKLTGFDNLSELEQRIESVIIELNDINTDFSSIRNSLNTDPQELMKMHNRLDLINSLLQKHRLSFDEQLIELKDDLNSRIELSSSFDVLLEENRKLIALKQKNLKESVNILNKSRLKRLPRIKEEVELILKKLGMPYAQFDIEMSEIEQFHINGNTSLLLKFSANKGSEMIELSKVASGGELSRLMLAVKYITAKSSQVNTLIFDEIDSGVSGKIASLMGDMMSDISSSNQLIAISHLPQIASRAETHLKVIKTVSKDETVSSVVELDKKARIQEIAKLLSGKKLTQAAIDNAVELLNQ